MTSVLLQRGKSRHRGEGRVKTETEVGVTRPQAKERQEPPEAGKDKTDPPLEPSKEAGACRHLDVRLLASRTVR